MSAVVFWLLTGVVVIAGGVEGSPLRGSFETGRSQLVIELCGIHVMVALAVVLAALGGAGFVVYFNFC